jgi:hypothetical protein
MLRGTRNTAVHPRVAASHRAGWAAGNRDESAADALRRVDVPGAVGGVEDADCSAPRHACGLTLLGD